MAKMPEPKIINETADYYVINKPAGMATEPPATTPTVRDWLLENNKLDRKLWDDETRYGIVHRLDSDTSGVLIWAKTPSAQQQLQLLWQGRVVEKKYLALVAGEIGEDGKIELPIMRDNKNDRQTVAFFPNPKSRPAITTYQRMAIGEINHNSVSLVKAHPITGRTHQLRVHLKAVGHPIVGDKLYGERSSEVVSRDLDLNRQFLHAESIAFANNYYSVPLPVDLKVALDKCGIHGIGEGSVHEDEKTVEQLKG